jgi:asparagine synthase (glutamine-hydrolysing)
MSLRPDERGYLVVDQSRATTLEKAIWLFQRDRLLALGWKPQVSPGALEILLGPRSPLKAVQIGPEHVLIGAWIRKAKSIVTVIGEGRDAEAMARGCVENGWGRYILAWRDGDRRMGLLRDPSGALDCIWWRYGSLLFASDQPPDAMGELYPENLAIDWEALGQIANTPAVLASVVPLQGFEPLLPGRLALVGEHVEQRTIWQPSDFCRESTPWDDDPKALARVVDEAVAETTRRHDRLVVEISGGLDSAIVASALCASGAGAKGSYINFYGDAVEGDERRYALEAARKCNVELQTYRKPVQPWTASMLTPLGWGVRPALHGVDVAYDQGVAQLVAAEGATGLLTGQGGDSVFLQSPDPLIAVDRRRRLGLRGFEPSYWADVARWTRHSAWSIAGLALWPPRRRTNEKPHHPWIDGAVDAPPAKAGQVFRISNCQLFWGDCLRARVGELIHPLLSQPVMEHFLAIPADRLTVGVRDRGLARRAFAERLPASIINRMDKGDLGEFYGRVVAASLGELRPFLLDGLLASNHIVDRADLERELTPESLLWGQASHRHLLHPVIETWARHWAERIERIRQRKVSGQPVQDAMV